MTPLTRLVEYYSQHFATQLAQYADYATLYGWLATSSAIVAFLTFIFALLRREAGRNSALAIGQHFLLWGLPIFLPSVIQFFTLEP